MHRICNHPEWLGFPRPEPAEMVGPCEHNMICPVCKFGWGCAPDPCDRKLTVPELEREIADMRQQNRYKEHWTERWGVFTHIREAWLTLTGRDSHPVPPTKPDSKGNAHE